MFKVCEVFRTIQGEGIDIGLPTIFVRFSGCNLKCTWCDTTYASRPENKFVELSLEELLQQITDFAPTASVTLTGGEPFIQNSEELDKLIYELKGRGFYINIETNGVLLPELAYGYLVDRFSISPKLFSSGNNHGIVISTLKKYLKNYKKTMFLKFVIGDKRDFEEMLGVLEIIGTKEELQDIPIVIQPNIDYETAESITIQVKRFKKLLDLLMIGNYTNQVKEFNIRIIPQFHKFLWANKRAV